jgi:osmotically-inducible protein OsmY
MKSDAQMHIDVTEALDWDPGVMSRDITVTTRDGIVTLSGTVPHFADRLAAEHAVRRVSGVRGIAEDLVVNLTGVHKRSDTDVATSVADALRWHVWIPKAVQATVDNGRVTLTGEVKWGFERTAAENAVRYLCGVNGITNSITIMPGVKPSAVRETIEKALVRDAEFDAARVVVSADAGRVTLSGSIGSWDERDKVGAAAWCAPGVTEVNNNLTVA